MAGDTIMRLRAVFAHLPGDPAPTFVGAADAGAWEVIPEEDWQPIVQRWKETWFPCDWESYDYRECFIEVPVSLAMFAAPTLPAQIVEGR